MSKVFDPIAENRKIKILEQSVVEEWCKQLIKMKNMMQFKLVIFQRNPSTSQLVQIAKFLQELNNLTVFSLKLSQSFIDDNKAMILGESIAKCANIQYIILDLNHSNLNIDVYNELTKQISFLNNLQKLDIKLGNLKSLDILPSSNKQLLIGQNLFNCKVLKEVNIQQDLNTEIEDYIIDIYSQLQASNSIENINMHLNFSQQKLLKLSNIIKGYKNLKRYYQFFFGNYTKSSFLDFFNDFNAQTLDEISFCFDQLQTHCIDKEVIDSLCQCIGKHISLSRIYLDISAFIFIKYSVYFDFKFENLTELKEIKVNFGDDNKIDGKTIENLGVAVSSLKHLQLLNLKFNCDNMSEQILLQFAQNLQLSKSLRSLSLDIIRVESNMNSAQEFLQIIQNIENLNYYSLNLNFQQIQGAILQSIIPKKCEKLELQLKHKIMPYDEAYTSLFNNPTDTLKDVVVTLYNGSISNNVFSSINSQQQMFNKLQFLNLDFQYIKFVEDDFFSFFGEFLSTLQDILKLKLAFSFTNIVFFQFIVLTQHLKFLNKLIQLEIKIKGVYPNKSIPNLILVSKQLKKMRRCVDQQFQFS